MAESEKTGSIAQDFLPVFFCAFKQVYRLLIWCNFLPHDGDLALLLGKFYGFLRCDRILLHTGTIAW
ncbi:hypothetical protein MPL1_02563 [Methylophaga lonarensis MPL]|uniref:Uncharacterized protein n=1 Tax=Methylophaga lonarensis MPL TaxID=1286106 RepID=M7P319_9GAMM|nr:hypothetical protein MPL1_02563 [Methylophaga lonarensis MPL]